jgi:hypothetical protein
MNEVENYHLTESAPLVLDRKKQRDVTSVPGTRSHYHYRFTGRGQLEMRWLTCKCVKCEAKHDEACVNAAYIGGWQQHTITQLSETGVAARTAARKELAEQIGHTIDPGDIIAAYTGAEDTTGRCKYWLGEVVQRPKEVTDRRGAAARPSCSVHPLQC